MHPSKLGVFMALGLFTLVLKAQAETAQECLANLDLTLGKQSAYFNNTKTSIKTLFDSSISIVAQKQKATHRYYEAIKTAQEVNCDNLGDKDYETIKESITNNQKEVEPQVEAKIKEFKNITTIDLQQSLNKCDGEEPCEQKILTECGNRGKKSTSLTKSFAVYYHDIRQTVVKELNDQIDEIFKKAETCIFKKADLKTAQNFVADLSDTLSKQVTDLNLTNKIVSEQIDSAISELESRKKTLETYYDLLKGKVVIDCGDRGKSDFDDIFKILSRHDVRVSNKYSDASEAIASANVKELEAAVKGCKVNDLTCAISVLEKSIDEKDSVVTAVATFTMYVNDIKPDVSQQTTKIGTLFKQTESCLFKNADSKAVEAFIKDLSGALAGQLNYINVTISYLDNAVSGISTQVEQTKKTLGGYYDLVKEDIEVNCGDRGEKAFRDLLNELNKFTVDTNMSISNSEKQLRSISVAELQDELKKCKIDDAACFVNVLQKCADKKDDAIKITSSITKVVNDFKHNLQNEYEKISDKAKEVEACIFKNVKKETVEAFVKRENETLVAQQQFFSVVNSSIQGLFKVLSDEVDEKKEQIGHDYKLVSDNKVHVECGDRGEKQFQEILTTQDDYQKNVSGSYLDLYTPFKNIISKDLADELQKCAKNDIKCYISVLLSYKERKETAERLTSLLAALFRKVKANVKELSGKFEIEVTKVFNEVETCIFTATYSHVESAISKLDQLIVNTNKKSYNFIKGAKANEDNEISKQIFEFSGAVDKAVEYVEEQREFLDVIGCDLVTYLKMNIIRLQQDLRVISSNDTDEMKAVLDKLDQEFQNYKTLTEDLTEKALACHSIANVECLVVEVLNYTSNNFEDIENEIQEYYNNLTTATGKISSFSEIKIAVTALNYEKQIKEPSIFEECVTNLGFLLAAINADVDGRSQAINEITSNYFTRISNYSTIFKTHINFVSNLIKQNISQLHSNKDGCQPEDLLKNIKVIEDAIDTQIRSEVNILNETVSAANEALTNSFKNFTESLEGNWTQCNVSYKCLAELFEQAQKVKDDVQLKYDELNNLARTLDEKAESTVLLEPNVQYETLLQFAMNCLKGSGVIPKASVFLSLITFVLVLIRNF